MTSKIHSLLVRKIPLRVALIVPFVLQIIFVAGAVGYLAFYSSQQAVNTVTRQLRAEINARIKEHLQSFLGVPQRINQSNATSLRHNHPGLTDPDALMHEFWEQVQIFDSVSSIYFGNTAGGLADAGREGSNGALYVISTAGFARGPFSKYATDNQGRPATLLTSLPDFDARTRPWYTGALKQQGATWSSIYVLFTGQDMAISASRPAYDEQHKLLGVVAVDIFLSHLSRFLQSMQIGQTGQSFIIERSGLLVAASTTEALFTPAVGKTPPQRLEAGQSANPLISGAAAALRRQFGAYQAITTDTPFEFALNGECQLGEVSPLPGISGPDWLVVTVIPAADFMGQINANNRNTAALISLALALTVGVGLVTAQWLTGPIARLTAASQAMTAGEWTQPLANNSWLAEISTVTGAFNQMSWQLHQSLERLTAEVAERQQAEAALRAKTEEVDRYFTNSLDMLCIADTQGFFLRLNPEWERSLGYSLSQLEGKRFLDLVHPDDMAATLESINLLNHQAPVRNFVNRYRHRDGSYRWIEWHSSPEGNLIYAAARDITERKLVEEALIESERKLRSIIEQSSDAIILTDETGQLIEWNGAAERIFGLKRTEVLGQMAWDIQFSILPAERQTPAVYERLKSLWLDYLQTGQHPTLNQIIEAEIQRPDGMRRAIQSAEFAIKTEYGFLLGNTIRDVTERNQMETALRESKEHLDLAIKGAGLGTWDRDVVTGRVVHNEQWAEMLGYTLAEIESNVSSWVQLLHPDDAPKVMAAVQDALDNRTSVFQLEYRLRTKSGDWKWILDTGKILKWDEQGRPLRAAGTHRDITGRKQAEAEREQIIAELQTALAQVKQLSGLLPICANCKKIRDDTGYWHQVEVYIRDRTDADFSHGICPDCKEKLYPRAQYPFLYQDE